jgi:peptidoglycan/xylan/chitin deacetylase (PgdA/CDA1 family)
MRIINDTLHSLFVEVVSLILLRRRDIIRGYWNGEKCICFSFDCDFRKDMEACKPIIELLRSEEIPASFAIAGNLAQTYPDVIEELIESNFEILNHTMSHPANFRSMSKDDIILEVEGFQEFMMKTYSYVPRGFRSPHGLRKVRTDLFKLLKEKGMYDSSLLGYGIANLNGIYEIPLTPCPEHPLMAFDTYHHFRFPVFSSSEGKLLRLWVALLHQSVFINVFLDPMDLTHRTRLRLHLLEQMIKRAKEYGFCFNRMDKLYEEARSS